jgi:hypothetical protein
MIKIRREMGGARVNASGKKIGETYGHVWNTTIKVGDEIGPPGGFYDDPQGQADLSTAYLAARKARCVIRGRDNWLHLFALDSFSSYDLKGKVGDSYVYLLTTGAQVTAERVTTSDGFELSFAKGGTGTGWRMKQILNELDQFAIGAFFGDVIEEPSVTMSIGQIIIGCIPIVGQIADLRDVGVGIYKMWSTGGKEGKLQTALALVGFIPLFGDGIKAVKKAFAKGGRDAAKEAFAKTLKEGIPEASESLAKQIIKDPDNVTKALNMSKKELKDLTDLASRATYEGGEAAEKYAATLTKHWETVGGNAAALVTIAGRKWKTVARALATSSPGEALGKKMQAWRVQQFDALEQRIRQKATDFGTDIQSAGSPQMVRTGTDSFLSDVDMSFMGPNATVHRHAAIRQIERQFGSDWKMLLDADILADPSRLHLFERPLAEMGGKTAREAEKRIVSEAEINVLAKMLRDGTDPAQIAKTARELGVNLAAVTARQKELATLSTDYLANMLRQGKTEAFVTKEANKLGVTIQAVKAHLQTGQDIYRQLELQMDVLHWRFQQAAGTPARQAQIAEEMAKIQGKLNAAVHGPYMTPGGAAKHATRREYKLRPKGAYQVMSPTLGYTALLDDFFMLQHGLKGAGIEFTEDHAKSMAKYGDRLLVTAGQFGADLGQVSTRALWDDLSLILQRARQEGKKVPLEKVRSTLDSVKNTLQGQLNDLAKAVKKNAYDYLGQPSPKVKFAHAERRSILEMLTRSEQVIAKQIALILRIQLRQSKETEKGSKNQ